MNPVYPEFVPEPTDSRETMEALQREIASRAVFADDFGFEIGDVAIRAERSLVAGSDATGSPEESGIESRDRPLVAGVDQAFLDDRVVSAIVCMRGGETVARVHAVSPLEFPYIPGLLSFREGGPILAALEELDAEPDLLVFDGSGRIHFREAGLATHIGLTVDTPAIGVAKKLLCGTPRDDTDDREAGTTIPIEATEDVSTLPGTVIGYAVQTKQYDGARYVNPLYVSPGHRVSAESAADLVLALADGYKLPEPTRRADAYAGDVKRTVE